MSEPVSEVKEEVKAENPPLPTPEAPAVTAEKPSKPAPSGSEENPYPKTVEEVLDDKLDFPDDVLKALYTYKGSKPWTGKSKERQKKMKVLVADLAKAMALKVPPKLIFVQSDFEQFVAMALGIPGPCYVPAFHTIFVVGKLSVVTLLHEFGHSMGLNEMQTCKWSINLFRKVFPDQFNQINTEGHMLRRPPKKKKKESII